MKTLNLVHPHESDIEYTISQFPDGQQDIVIDLKLKWNSGYVDKELKGVVEIKSRFNSFKDLELIICATKALRRLGIKEIHLYIPYLLGARSDRQFVNGGTSYLVDVIAPIINSLEFESVAVMDVHSDVAAACIKNLKVIDNTKLVNTSLFGITKEIAGVKGIYPGMLNKSEYLDKFILISPDAGSLKKIYKVADAIGYKGEIITCSKHRDNNGVLSRVNVPLEHKHLRKDYVIIDDICDGGATFINIAKGLKTHMQNDPHAGKIYLIVTHGIFSKGFEELSKYFDSIYCTNSYSTVGNYAGNDLEKTNVKQFNVF